MKHEVNFTPANCFSGTSETKFGNQFSKRTSSEISGLPLGYFDSNDYEILVAGTPHLRLPNDAPGVSFKQIAVFGQHLVDILESRGPTAFAEVRGKFALAVRNKRSNSILIAVDRFASIPIFFAKVGSQIVFAESCSAMPDQLRSDDQISEQSLYAYLFFHTIPGPDSIYKQISKLPPASFLYHSKDRSETNAYWMPDFAEKTTSSFNEQKDELRRCLADAIPGSLNSSRVGCFLSGGLDSSTVLGYLSRAMQGEPQAFSIGFGADGYDEMEYARTAAKHFGANLHEYYVTRTDIIDVIPEIASAYDQPFGNSSAVPTLYCARLAAANGIEVMLAGDGGDEIFAGNERYAKQKLFEYYNRLPGSLRKYVLEPMFLEPSPLRHMPILRKGSRYIEQAIIDMPDRLETYNYLQREGIEEVLSNRLIGKIAISAPMSGLRSRYWQPEGASTLNRMLYLDWKFTLADNDLPKVTRMCQIAGVQVEFPFLHDDLVEFSTTVPSNRKLPGTKLRYFFRQSVADFLPEMILNKKKHGFGLPFGTWLVTDPQLRKYTYKSLDRLRDRELFAPKFIDSVKVAAEEEHAAYYGTMLWVLMMLEEWLSQHH